MTTDTRWALFDDHAGAIRAYAARRVEPDAVDDVVADTFAIAWRRLPRHAEDPLPWLYAVARRVVHGHRRSGARRTALVARLRVQHGTGGGAGGGGDPAELVGDDLRLARAFATLSEREREAIALVAWEGLDGERAATAAGCTPATFAVRLSRARAKLRAALAAGAVIAAVAFALTSGTESEPAVAQVVAHAAAAAQLPADRIVVSESAVRFGAGRTLRRTTWVRLGADGRVLQARFLVTAATGGASTVGAEEATDHRGAAGPVTLRRDPATGTVTRDEGAWGVPSLVLSAPALLERARRADGVRLDGEETVAGRRALRLDVTGVQEEALPGDRDVLLLDAETYAPIALRRHAEGIAVDGEPYENDTVERVVEQRVLPDTPEHRAALELGGPTGQG